MVMLNATMRNPHGLVSWTDKETGEVLGEFDCFQCCHCQYTCQVKRGSGVQRGFCFLCNAPTCGRYKCSQGCEPFEAKLEAWEGRKRFARAMGGY